MVYGPWHAVVQAVYGIPPSVRVSSHDSWRISIQKPPLVVPREGSFENLSTITEAEHTTIRTASRKRTTPEAEGEREGHTTRYFRTS